IFALQKILIDRIPDEIAVFACVIHEKSPLKVSWKHCHYRRFDRKIQAWQGVSIAFFSMR
ncbi:MAG: hypothetical protein IJ240_03355, partial [Clostridia bacterium]|nr:hypothetical protein [Clostridia bacterium]